MSKRVPKSCKVHRVPGTGEAGGASDSCNSAADVGSDLPTLCKTNCFQCRGLHDAATSEKHKGGFCCLCCCTANIWDL